MCGQSHAYASKRNNTHLEVDVHALLVLVGLPDAVGHCRHVVASIRLSGDKQGTVLQLTVPCVCVCKCVCKDGCVLVCV